LQSVLYGSKEKGRARWALANGYMEQRAVSNAALTSEQLSGGKMEDSRFKECICIDGKAEIWYATLWTTFCSVLVFTNPN
jgi:hypothetical protein